MMLQVISTGDNSPTLYVPELDETYHSRNGALLESMHVFIRAGLHFLPPDLSINILEIGFGTGLNALLTGQEAQKRTGNIHYHALETRPLEVELISQLKLHELPGIGSEPEIMLLHQAAWDEPLKVSDSFTITKHLIPVQAFQTDVKFDLVYFDAFGPDKQPELWTLEIFEKLYAMMHQGGILVTYSAKGDVKRNLKACGFEVERLPGPPMKRHMTRAKKI